LYIPLSESFSGSLNVQIYKESSFNPMISSDITFILSESTLPYTHFVYAKKHFQVTPINENIEVSQDYNFSVKAVDLDGSTMSTFTG
jgi:predicted RNA-binding protein associated with RNAse of E/G family